MSEQTSPTNQQLEQHQKDIGAIPESGRLGKIIDALAFIFAGGIVLSMSILIIEIIMRRVFNAPTFWAHETTIFLCGIAFIFGGLYCVARDQHIRVVLIYDFVSQKIKRILDIIISLISMVAAGMFAWASWIMVQRAAFRPDGSFRLERSGSAWDPVYPALIKISLFVIMFIMCIQFAILAFNYAKGRHS